MCELFSMSSRLPTDVNFSLAEFSRHGSLSGPYTDGWGIAYYEDGDLRLIKEAEPAGDSDWVRFIEDHTLRSTVVISHIRKASHGRPVLKNTQPFSRELAGRMHVFAHNGRLEGVQDMSSLRMDTWQPIGETDSEYAFCALLGRLRTLWLPGVGVPPLTDRLEIMATFAAELRLLGPANFLYTDGDAIFAHGHKRTHPDGMRPPGLYTLCRQCIAEEQPVLTTEGLTITSPTQEVVLVASVPLTDEAWAPLDEGEVVVVSEGNIVKHKTFDAHRPSAV